MVFSVLVFDSAKPQDIVTERAITNGYQCQMPNARSSGLPRRSLSEAGSLSVFHGLPVIRYSGIPVFRLATA